MSAVMTEASVAGMLDVSPDTGADWFQRWALYSPDAVAILDDATGRSFSYAECNRLVGRAAAILSGDFGVRHGDRVAVLSANEPEYVLLLFACQRIGAILLPMNVKLTAPEIGHILDDSGATLLIAQRQFEGTIATLNRTGLQILSFDGPGGYLARLADGSGPVIATGSARLADTCMILYTSGTTGAPKGALITNAMLFWNSINTTMRLNVVQSDVTITYTPLFYTGGWHVLTTPFLHRGAKIVMLRKFDPDRVLEICEREKVTILFGLPTTMRMLRGAAAFGRVSLESVRFAIVGGEPMPVDLIREWHARGILIRQGYGLTEFGPNVFSLQEEHAEKKIGSIGFPNFYVDADVVDDNDVPLPAGEVGELVLRGPVCTPGYWNNRRATADTIRNGWFHTGDLVRRDAEGFYYVVDRKKDMYKTGGQNVYPAEVEKVIRGIGGVREAAVLGVPDERWGEAGKVFIVLQPGAALTEDEIRRYCEGRLARYKIPAHVAFVADLPKGETGKVLKRMLRGTT